MFACGYAMGWVSLCQALKNSAETGASPPVILAMRKIVKKRGRKAACDTRNKKVICKTTAKQLAGFEYFAYNAGSSKWFAKPIRQIDRVRSCTQLLKRAVNNTVSHKGKRSQ